MTISPIWNPKNLEVNATEHCNVACAGCSHLSPIMRKKNLDVDGLARDLEKLTRVYRAAAVKVVGGEPLLHPELKALLQAIRRSGVTERISICTNGVLLHRMPSEVWNIIDHLEVSIYPGTRLEHLDFADVRKRADAAGVSLEMFEYFTFRKSYSESYALPEILTPRVFRSCQVAHHWLCHTIHEGVFYRCPQSLFLSRRFGGSSNGVPLDSPNLHERLSDLLTRETPLDACRRCLGTVGKSYQHYQADRRNWQTSQQDHPEDMIDYSRLAVLEADVTSEDVGDCAPWKPESATS